MVERLSVRRTKRQRGMITAVLIAALLVGAVNKKPKKRKKQK